MVRFLRYLLLFVGLPGLCLAQEYRPGFIVELDGDTLPGYVRYDENQHFGLQCCFRANPQAPANCFEATELSSYGFNSGRVYVSVQLPGYQVPLFVQMLAYGRAALYKHNKRYYGGRVGDQLFELISKDTVVVRTSAVNGSSRTSEITIKDRKFAQLLYVYIMADCPAVKIRLDRAALQDSDLIRIFNIYNQCRPGDRILYSEQLPELLAKPRFELRAGIGLGWRFSTLGIANVQNKWLSINRQAMHQPSPIIWVNPRFPRASERMSLQLGLSYVSESFLKHIENDFSGASVNRQFKDIWFQAGMLRFPVLIQYEQPMGRVKPYLAIGPGWSFVLWSDNLYREENHLGRVINQEQRSLLDVRRTASFLQASLGVTYPISKKYSLLVEGRYEYQPVGVSNAVGLDLSYRTIYQAFQLAVGLSHL